ncbi:tetratricopeptide repeat protein [Reyranella sp.]|uniref:tetratricopeptide repeat protein n=1 Tax=Reyranella sp. TaxID=1929291 RepID=UPI002F94BDCB
MSERSFRSCATVAMLSVAAICLSSGLAVAQQERGQATEASPPSATSAEEARNKADDAYKKQDYAAAVRWHRIAAGQGDIKSQIALGDLYSQGQGIHPDYAEAFAWYMKAAEQGSDEAQNDVGFFYLSGWGVQRNYTEAMRWLRKAADQGNEVAQRNIGIVYLQGLGVRKDRHEAIRWLRKAAEKGDEDAKEALKYLGVK